MTLQLGEEGGVRRSYLVNSHLIVSVELDAALALGDSAPAPLKVSSGHTNTRVARVRTRF